MWSLELKQKVNIDKLKYYKIYLSWLKFEVNTKKNL